MKKWLVMYGRGRSLRRPGSTGGVSQVKQFASKSEAEAFVAECENAGMRANVSEFGAEAA